MEESQLNRTSIEKSVEICGKKLEKFSLQAEINQLPKRFTGDLKITLVKNQPNKKPPNKNNEENDTNNEAHKHSMTFLQEHL